MRTVETLFVIVIVTTGFVLMTQFTVLPSTRSLSSSTLRELARSTLETFDNKGELTRIVFNSSVDSWNTLETALAVSLPPNIVYNLSVYNLKTSDSGVVTYTNLYSISNSEGDLGAGSETASYLVASPNMVFTLIPKKIENTLYILNCNDSNGWWITGYTAQNLALDLQGLLSPYFERTVLVNSTNQLGLLLNNSTLAGETLHDAVVINTFGEAIPIPTDYLSYSANSYAEYCYVLGQRVNQYNWTWVSIVGYPFYYVTNTVEFADSQNTWGIYGMVHVGRAGIHAFLQGLDNQEYSYDSSGITGPPLVVQLSPEAKYYSNYYGLYPASNQTSTRALSNSILSQYNLNIDPSTGYVFDAVDGWLPGATYQHVEDNQVRGKLTAIGLARIPDIRVTALALLMHFHPILYMPEYTAEETSRLIVLQLAEQGGT